MLVSLRHELPTDEESHGWELNWDGLRAIAYVSAECTSSSPMTHCSAARQSRAGGSAEAGGVF